jgi:eukaryotic-like serine/threonine-protein kinase
MQAMGSKLRRLGGRYELVESLGMGGMAEAYRAQDRRLHRAVAVKMLRPDLAADPGFHAWFAREARAAAALNHPAIVAVHDTGQETIDRVSIPYLVMEHVEGATLAEWLHRGGVLPPWEALRITSSVLAALDHSHRHGIVHRTSNPGM